MSRDADLESPLLHERLRAYRLALGWRVRPGLDVFFEICKLFDADPVAMYYGSKP
jgi:hypothetical protein